MISSAGSWCILYFMIVVFFGSFYLINLVLAVVAVSYEQEAENVANRVSQFSLHFKSFRLYKLVAQSCPRLLCNRVLTFCAILSTSQACPVLQLCVDMLCYAFYLTSLLHSVFCSCLLTFCAILSQEKYYDQLKTIASSYSLHNKFIPLLLFDHPNTHSNSDVKLPDVVVLDQNPTSCIRSFGRKKRLKKPASTQASSQHVFQSSIHPSQNSSLATDVQSNSIKTTTNGHQSVEKQVSLSGLSTASCAKSPEKNFSSTESDAMLRWRPYQDKPEEDLTLWNKIRLNIFLAVSNGYFEFAVTVFIFLNTLCLALEYHGMNPFLKEALAVLNHVSRTLQVIANNFNCSHTFRSYRLSVSNIDIDIG